MTVIGQRSIQAKVIKEMTLLTHEDKLDPWSIHRAARHVSGDDDPLSPRCSPRALVTIGTRQVERWYNIWMQFGYLPCELPKIYLVEFETRWSSFHDKALKKIVDDCPVLYLDEIAADFLKVTGRKFSMSSISRRLRFKLRYSRKVIYEKATQQLAREKSNFIATMRFYIKKPEMAIFVDESHKDRKAARRKYGWFLIGYMILLVSTMFLGIVVP